MAEQKNVFNAAALPLTHEPTAAEMKNAGVTMHLLEPKMEKGADGLMHKTVTVRITADQVNNIASYTHAARDKDGKVVNSPDGNWPMQVTDGIAIASDKGVQVAYAPKDTVMRVEVVGKDNKVIASNDGLTGIVDRSKTRGATGKHPGQSGSKYGTNTIIGHRYEYLADVRHDLTDIADGKAGALTAPEKTKLKADLAQTKAFPYYADITIQAIVKKGGKEVHHGNEAPEGPAAGPEVLAQAEAQTKASTTLTAAEKKQIMDNLSTNAPAVWWDKSADDAVMQPRAHGINEDRKKITMLVGKEEHPKLAMADHHGVEAVIPSAPSKAKPIVPLADRKAEIV